MGDEAATSSELRMEEKEKEEAVSAGNSRVVVNRKRQFGNPMLQYIRVVRYEWGECGADIEVSGSVGIVYLALSYHKLHPGYIHTRLGGKAEQAYTRRILLLVQNVSEPRHALRELSLASLRHGFSLLLCFSIEEAAEYVESLRLSDGRDPRFIGQKRAAAAAGQEGDEAKLAEQAVGMLKGARGVTKADGKRLLTSFRSLSHVARASKQQLELCPGLGPIRAPNLHAYLRMPFSS